MVIPNERARSVATGSCHPSRTNPRAAEEPAT